MEEEKKEGRSGRRSRRIISIESKEIITKEITEREDIPVTDREITKDNGNVMNSIELINFK